MSGLFKALSDIELALKFDRQSTLLFPDQKYSFCKTKGYSPSIKNHFYRAYYRSSRKIRLPRETPLVETLNL